ncbi:S-DNA-T family DNA segregation ATPase FtsK/SpoIIIE [Arthrobacter sp. B3I9]|uniref:FtsK/SpoIIIE domain-containing protein n=1 Tax=Arthrobacter sp. B3I9 TaxID=3042270 RepID=UPI0027944B45|nr:FtsK/SpoIIIE domain-containing protein [Arthrobacter sp. B3I9]MDQ0849535.1 S-DNA-T family DNA segregation ATPase FtsK/SpoIIIE [Arthrobacter sp. B3I9]
MLHCTLVPAPGSRLPGPIELAVEAPPECSGADFQRAISRRYGTGDLTVNGSPVRAQRVGDPPLRNGAVLVDGGVRADGGVWVDGGATGGGRAAPQLFLAVHSGASAGTIVPLVRGRFRIGRSGTDLAIPDAELSREHARLEISDSTVTLVDLNSANGTTVDGGRIRRAVVTTESLIRCGNSTMSLFFGVDSAAAGVSDAAGRSVAEPLAVGGPSNGAASGTGRATMLLVAALPLAAGVGLAVFAGSWMFLAFSLASAASLLVPAVTGRKQRRELKASLDERVREDTERRRLSAPSAAQLYSSAARPVEDRGPTAVKPDAVWLRLGLSEQRANLSLPPGASGLFPPSLGLMPLTLDPAVAVTAVDGPPAAVAGLVHSLLMQLAGYPAACRTHVLVHGSPENLPLAARFLPRVTLSCHLSATAARLAAGPGSGCERGVLIILTLAGAESAGRVQDTSWAAGLGSLAASKGWQVLQFGPLPGPSDAAIVLRGGTAWLRRGRSMIPFLPDLVPCTVFDDFCRRLGSAGTAHADPQDAMPATVPLARILPLDATDVARRWVRSADTMGMPVPVGVSKTGPVLVDIVHDGPHLLVAGTTGSGKSEILRTLAAALAASYPPDRISLLFVDFKGGSGLGPLTGLPHCVGMLTDLGLPEVDRTLVSLRSEVRRREELLAAAHVGDLGAYRSLGRALPALPHLVVVIDEFRILVEEAPRALAELMRIAAIGRSLGIHLVMATQRPQGAINADIRANVTSRIALRVQSGMESVDVLNSPLAADIPIAAPGRAFLVKGTEVPTEFQTATLTPDRPSPAGQAVTVLAAADWLSGQPAEVRTAVERPVQPPSPEAAALADVARTIWTASGGLPPRRPVAGPLPPLLPFPPSGSSGPPPASPPPSGSGRTGAVRLGWLDMPEQQRLAELCWHPDADGHLGFIGRPTGAGAGAGMAFNGAAGDADSNAVGGTDEALALAVAQLLAAEQESHLYILDAAGSFHRAAGSPRVGAVAGPHEQGRAVRVLERLAGEMARRLSMPRVPAPRLVLAVCGWGSWVSAFRSGPLIRGEELVHDIVRDGAKAGIAVLISGERELTTSRFYGNIANRLFFPAGSPDDVRLTWPRLPEIAVFPGRVAAQGPFTGTPADAPHVAQLYRAPLPGSPAGLPAPLPTPLLTPLLTPLRQAPFRVDALPSRVGVADVLARIGDRPRAKGLDAGSPIPKPEGTDARASGSRPHVRLFLGVGGDELGPVSLTLPTGSVLAALGGPGSGKTSLLAALPGLNSPPGGCLQPGRGKDPAGYWAGLLAKARAGALHPEAVLLADDLDLQSEDCNRQLSGLNTLGWTVVLTAGFGPVFQQRVPLAQCARRQGAGILIRPRSLLDSDFFGVRFEPEANPPPGRAVVVLNGQATAVQLADPAAGSARPDIAS